MTRCECKLTKYELSSIYCSGYNILLVDNSYCLDSQLWSICTTITYFIPFQELLQLPFRILVYYFSFILIIMFWWDKNNAFFIYLFFLHDYWLEYVTLKEWSVKISSVFWAELIYVKAIMGALTRLLKLHKLELDLESRSKLHSLNYSESHHKK